MAGDANIVTGNYSGRKIIIHLWMKITDSVGSATMLFLYRELPAFIRMTPLLGFDKLTNATFLSNPVKIREKAHFRYILQCSFNLKRI